MSKICIIDDCGKKHEAKGYCKNHYKSYMKYGNPLHVEDRKKFNEEKRISKQANRKPRYSTDGVCNVDGCNKPIKAQLLCEAHYARKRRNGTTERKTLPHQEGKKEQHI